MNDPTYFIYFNVHLNDGRKGEGNTQYKPVDEKGNPCVLGPGHITDIVTIIKQTMINDGGFSDNFTVSIANWIRYED